jgi:alpha-L-rhamnosidase
MTLLGAGTQTGYVVTLHAGLYPPSLEAALTNNLVAAIEKNGGHLSTGFLGTPFLLFALSDHGRADVAYKFLLNDSYPSWGYMIKRVPPLGGRGGMETQAIPL